MEVFPSINELRERQHKLELARKEVEKITDKLGTPVDTGIKETVAIFRALGITTSSSCAGHKDEEEGYAIPYIQVYAPAPQGWKEDKQKQEQWKQANLKQREKLQPLLEEFNKSRKTIQDARLYFRNIGLFGGFTVESIAKIKSSSIPEAIEMITAFQKEMSDFTSFLKQRFF